MKVPRCRPELSSDAVLAINNVLKSGQFVKGPRAKELEHDFADYCGVPEAVTTNSGTSALYLALKAYGLQPTDEVIVPVNSFMATANAVANVCRIIFSDVDEHTFNIDPLEVERLAKRKNVKAIIPVHLYGQCADMNFIMEIAKENNLVVIEDACQAHGAKINGTKAGALGDMAAFSFFPTKNIHCAGDGGIVTAKEETLASYMRALKDNGRMPGSKDDCAFPGLNLRLSEIQAAVAIENLKTIDANNNRRRRLAKVYEECLSEEALSNMAIPHEINGKHIYHLYTINCNNRDGLMDYLRKNDIGCNVNYGIQLNKLSAYKKEFGNTSYPIADRLQNNILSLPMDATLHEEEIEYVAKMINGFYKK